MPTKTKAGRHKANVTANAIQNVLDTVSFSHERIQTLRVWLIQSPGDFWPAITQRSLGKKRLFVLELLALEMAESEDELTRTCGQYVMNALRARPARLHECDDFVTFSLIHAGKLIKAGDMAGAARVMRYGESAAREAVTLTGVSNEQS